MEKLSFPKCNTQTETSFCYIGNEAHESKCRIKNLVSEWQTDQQPKIHFIETHFNEEYFRNDMNYIKFSIKSPGTIWLQKCNRIFIPCNCCYMHTVWILWAFQRIKSHPLRKFHSIRLFDILYSPFLPRNDSIEAMNIFILETRIT